VEPLPTRVDILGVGVSAIDPGEALRQIGGWLDRRESHYVCVNTVHSLLCAQDDPSLLDVYREAAMVTPDGMPLVWLSRRRGRPEVRRVYGPDLMLACCDVFRERGARHYFYGGAEGVPELLTERLTERFPGLQVAGGYSPPFRPLSKAEDAEIVERINAARPDFVWVGLGAPKQDHWMAEHVGRLTAPVLLGVGAAFDFHAGLKKQAPAWMQERGLEWLFRLLSEPRRLAGRYVAGNSRFVALVLAEELRLHR
jgi:N-acetylglucosaminyldiphosphoundecaprenol N-acetyl-beta-D-mannosaminyltransferase